MKDSRSTQRAKILELLLSARGDWVPLPRVMDCAAQYNARIFELRRMGFRIPAPKSRIVAGQRHTWYRIEFGEKTKKPANEAPSGPATFPQFGSLASEKLGIN